MEAIKKYLSSIAERKEAFFGSGQTQAFMDEFDQILVANKDFVLQNHPLIRDEINAYCSKPESANHIQIGRRLTRQLNEFVFRQQAQNASCNCNLKKELNIHPEKPMLDFIAKEFDGYYHSEVYKCNSCDQIWTLEFLDDGTSRWV